MVFLLQLTLKHIPFLATISPTVLMGKILFHYIGSLMTMVGPMRINYTHNHLPPMFRPSVKSSLNRAMIKALCSLVFRIRLNPLVVEALRVGRVVAEEGIIIHICNPVY